MNNKTDVMNPAFSVLERMGTEKRTGASFYTVGVSDYKVGFVDCAQSVLSSTTTNV